MRDNSFLMLEFMRSSLCVLKLENKRAKHIACKPKQSLNTTMK